MSESHPTMSWINSARCTYAVRRSVVTVEADQTVRDLHPGLTLDFPSEQVVLQTTAIKADHHLVFVDAFVAVYAGANDAVLLAGSPELLFGDAHWGCGGPPMAQDCRATTVKSRSPGPSEPSVAIPA